ncbi:MAG: T9SS type A sorting domain-containing protein [Bacteroidales bacterium]|nr:T9SS type A sorting domain-containing protein [Bacteroidales bacterium]
MKSLFFSILFTCVLLISSHSLHAQPIHDTITMGSGYANDVFYSFENGVVKIEARNNWDIAFYTSRWSAGIIANDGMGVSIYTYPLNDTNGWNSVDVSGIDSWTPLFNSDTIWEDGAFNRNSLGHPDYGWGVYNTINHDVVGDSLYIVKMADGSFRKLWIQRKNSVANTFEFKFANIDGSNEVSQQLNATPYENKLFVYYNLMIAQVVDREPAKDSWDILFSRYMAIVYDIEGNPSYYPVVGILNNPATGANRFHPVADDFEDWTAAPMENHKTPIGHNWKTFDMNSFSWLIQEDLAYFVQTQQGNVYKFVPDYFSGTGTGKTGFVKKVVSLVSVGESASSLTFAVYPNPANSMVTINLTDKLANNGSLKVFDQTGRLVFQQKTTPDQKQFQINLDQYSSGLYFIHHESGSHSGIQKLIIQH